MLNKSNLQLKILPSLSKVAANFGVDWLTLGQKFRREAIIGQMSIMFKQNFPEIEKAEKPLDIIFLAYLGCFQGNNAIQATLGKILKEKGHKVRFVLCDIELPICETTEITNHSNRSTICAQQNKHLKLFFEQTDFEIIWLSDLVPNSIIEELGNDLDDCKWDTYVESILLRYFKVGVLDLNNPLMDELFSRARHAALISEKLGEAIAKLNPDRVIFSHGTYTTRGPAKDVLNNKGVPALSISRAKIAESQKFNWKTAGDWWSVNNEWDKVGSLPLNDRQERILEDYLQSRRNHKRDIIVYNKTSEETKELTYNKLGLDSSKRIYTLFTNVLWDAASAQREIAFSNPVDWTIETIEWFRNHPDRQLIVRIHPAENIIGTNQPMINLIKGRMPNIPDNVILVDPAAPINSWSLLKITDVGIVHTSTVGMELALEGIPCICVSKTHYRSKGFTVDIQSKENYFDLLSKDKFDDFNKIKTIDLARRYSYLLFLRYQLPMPFYYPLSHISIHSFKEMDWGRILKEPSIPIIINGIEQQEEFLLPDEIVYKIYE